jgi:hypothetical protein
MAALKSNKRSIQQPNSYVDEFEKKQRRRSNSAIFTEPQPNGEGLASGWVRMKIWVAIRYATQLPKKTGFQTLDRTGSYGFDCFDCVDSIG